VKSKGFPDIAHGSSFVMAADMNGTACPDSRSILTYSLSANPSSPYYADQTKLFSEKKWVDMRFCTHEILRDAQLQATELGCLANSGFKKAGLKGGRSLRFAFTRRYAVPVIAKVYRARSGKLVKGFHAGKAFTWKRAGRLAPGAYFARVSALGRTGRPDVREFAFRVRGGRVVVSKRAFSLRERCALLRDASLGSPQFSKRMTVRFRLASKARVALTVRRGGKRVKRVGAVRLGAGKRRLTVRGLPAGTYRLTIEARAGKQRSSTTLTATRP
jgi:hypothetical protein